MDWIFNIGFAVLGAMAGAILANQTIVVWLHDLPKLSELNGKNKLNESYTENAVRTRAMLWVIITMTVISLAFFFMTDPSWFVVGLLATFLGSYMNSKAKPERLKTAFKEKYKRFMK